MKKSKLIRLTTVDISLESLLRGQLHYLNQYFEVLGVADDSGKLAKVAEREGIRVENIPMHREISLLKDCISLWRLIRLFRKERPRIIHANTPKASLLSMIAAWINRVPHRIYYVTGLRFETTTGVLRFVLKFMERITCFCATKVIPEGDGVKKTLYRERITRKPLSKIHNGNINGIDTAYFDRTPEVEAKADSIREKDTFSFVFIGRMVRDKGINELVRAFDKLARENIHVRLFLVGSFEDRLDPIDAATKEIIANNRQIRVVGYQRDVRPYLAASDTLVLPSYREGFPNVILQAGAMGLPCIVTDINGCNEVITQNLNGTIIPKQDEASLFDAMKRFSDTSDEVVRMASQTRSLIVSRYRQEDIWAAMLEMYRNL